MARTRVPSEQLNFRSQNTGTTLLDTYLEDAEMGGLSLATLMGKLFNEATGDIDAFEFRYTNENDTQTLELRIGTDGQFQEIASFTQLFTDLADFKATTLADMEEKRADAEESAGEALASENAALAAQSATESARDAALAARDKAEDYRNQAFATTPTVIEQGILVAQLHGDLFNGSTL